MVQKAQIKPVHHVQGNKPHQRVQLLPQLALALLGRDVQKIAIVLVLKCVRRMTPSVLALAAAQVIVQTIIIQQENVVATQDLPVCILNLDYVVPVIISHHTLLVPIIFPGFGHTLELQVHRVVIADIK